MVYGIDIADNVAAYAVAEPPTATVVKLAGRVAATFSSSVPSTGVTIKDRISPRQCSW